jgi:SAICAR synthetase
MQAQVEQKEVSEETAFSQDAVTIRTRGYLPTLQKRWDELKVAPQPPSHVSTDGIQHARGKVRDRFWKEDDDDASTVLVLWTTDRQSGFDRDLCVVPYKGAVLNLCSVFWFEQTRDIIGNHFISAPHPSVSLVRKCRPFPIEFVVRYVCYKGTKR